jgi:transcriptional regulator with XRE-family HTH domain
VPSVGRVDAQAEIRGFLSACRARLSPQRAGVPAYGGLRRVPGLRREEVAHLSGVSVDYYTRLERGRVGGVSDAVLDSIARALQLDDVEREHLFHLAHALRATSSGPRPTTARPQLQSGISRVLQALTLPAFVHNSCLDVLAANDTGRVLYPSMAEGDGLGFNHVRFQFLDPAARRFFRDWEATARYSVSLLRASIARVPDDASVANLIAEVSRGSARFRQMWSDTHDVDRLRRGRILLRHPAEGDLDFAFEAFDSAADPGLVLVVYIPDRATLTDDVLRRPPPMSME